MTLCAFGWVAFRSAVVSRQDKGHAKKSIDLLHNLLNRKIRPLCTLSGALQREKRRAQGGCGGTSPPQGPPFELVFEINSDIKMPQIFEGCKSFKRGPLYFLVWDC